MIAWSYSLLLVSVIMFIELASFTFLCWLILLILCALILGLSSSPFSCLLFYAYVFVTYMLVILILARSLLCYVFSIMLFLRLLVLSLVTWFRCFLFVLLVFLSSFSFSVSLSSFSPPLSSLCLSTVHESDSENALSNRPCRIYLVGALLWFSFSCSAGDA